MSVITWFISLWHKIFDGDLDDQIKEYVKYAVEAFQYIKTGLSNPTLHKVTDAIPGDWDLKIVDAVEVACTKILDELLEGQACLNLTTFGDKFRCFLSMASGKDEVAKTKLLNSFVVSLGIELVKEFVAKKFDLNKILLLVPAVFIELFGGKKD